MRLRELQRRMAAALFTPLAPSRSIAKSAAGGRSMRAEAEALIKPNRLLSSMERLEIYSRSYWFRVLDAFREDFTGLCAVLGERAFQRLSEAYLAELPSRSYTLRDLGSRLAPWLEAHPAYAGGNPDLALDMARLEWAHIESWDAAERKALGPEDLLELRPDVRFGLQPHIRLLRLRYPVDELRIRLGDLTPEQGGASNTVMRRRQRAAVRRVRALRPEPVFLAVHRLRFRVYYKRLASAEFRTIEALRAGAGVASALAAVAPARRSGQEDFNAHVERWFATWARLGWLVSHERQRK